MTMSAGKLLDDIISDHDRQIIDLLTCVAFLESEMSHMVNTKTAYTSEQYSGASLGDTLGAALKAREPSVTGREAAEPTGLKRDGMRLVSWQEWIAEDDDTTTVFPPAPAKPRKQGGRGPDLTKRRERITPVTSHKDEIIQWRNSGYKIREIVHMLKAGYGIDTDIQTLSANLKRWGYGAYGKGGLMEKAREVRARDELISG